MKLFTWFVIAITSPFWLIGFICDIAGNWFRYGKRDAERLSDPLTEAENDQKSELLRARQILGRELAAMRCQRDEVVSLLQDASERLEKFDARVATYRTVISRIKESDHATSP